ncbi:MAG: ATP-binding protein [Thermoanaerobaculia bacterium]
MTASRRRHALGIPAAVWGVLALGLAAVGLLLALDRFQLASWEHEARLGRLASVTRRQVAAARRADPAGADREQALHRAAAAAESLADTASAAARDERDDDDLVLEERARELSERLAALPVDAPAAALEPFDDAASDLEDLVDAHAGEHRESARTKLQAAVAAWLGALVLAVAGLFWRERRRRETEEALEESRRRLAQAQKMDAVGRLAGGIAHDINNHLAAIRGQCELIERKEMPRERVLEKMGVVQGTVLKASSLVERLLAFGRRQPSHPELVDLDEVVEELSAVLAGSLPREIVLDLDLAPAPVPVVADVSQIEQILANLCVNARDAIAGSGRIVIATSTDTEGGRPVARLSVSDSGCGIPPEHRERVFDPFFTTKSGQGSTGLGLATVYALVEEAGGGIDLDSEPGKGTRFTVTLPLATGATSGAARPRDRGERRGDESILLVDDNEELASAAQAHLEGLGYRVRHAASSRDALAEATAGELDLVIADVQLADGTGPDLVEAIRRRRPVRALYMSGYTDRIALRSGPRRGEAFFVKKPFSLDGLARMTRELLDEEQDVALRPESSP